MKKISSVWTLIYKEEGAEPHAYTYKSEADANSAYAMVKDSDGEETFNNDGSSAGFIKYEYCNLFFGKLIEPTNI